MAKRAQAQGLYVPLESVRHTTDKIGRIQSLQPLVKSGALQFSRKHATLLEQLRLFPKAAHDDGPDALEMAVDAGKRAASQRWTVDDLWCGPPARAAVGRVPKGEAKMMSRPGYSMWDEW